MVLLGLASAVRKTGGPDMLGWLDGVVRARQDSPKRLCGRALELPGSGAGNVVDGRGNIRWSACRGGPSPAPSLSPPALAGSSPRPSPPANDWFQAEGTLQLLKCPSQCFVIV